MNMPVYMKHNRDAKISKKQKNSRHFDDHDENFSKKGKKKNKLNLKRMRENSEQD